MSVGAIVVAEVVLHNYKMHLSMFYEMKADFLIVLMECDEVMIQGRLFLIVCTPASALNDLDLVMGK